MITLRVVYCIDRQPPSPLPVIITSSEWSLSVGPQDKEDGGKTDGVWEALVSR